MQTLLLVLLAACGGGDGPQVEILAPADGSSFAEGRAIGLLGQVSDPDGLQDVAEVRWSSDLDGDLGASVPSDLGHVSLSVTLTPGTHAVRLDATDREGTSGYRQIALVVSAAPVAEITAPADAIAVLAGAPLTLTGTATGGTGTLAHTWTAQPAGGATATLASGPVGADGVVEAVLDEVALGEVLVRLTVTDAAGASGSAAVTVTGAPASAFDLDGDGYSADDGDCADDDPDRSPDALEACNGVDDDCSGEADDKDLDGDGHVDAACDAAGGEDCDDANAELHPGTDELGNGLDDDCDGETDEGTTAYDDDGDCFCEAAPCVDGADAACDALTGGDCLDAGPGAAATHPGALDEPDLLFQDLDCDGFDGDLDAGVFLAPTGDDGADCTVQAPCRTLAHALDRAHDDALPIYAQAGTYTGPIEVLGPLEIHGGYDADWVRDLHTEPGHEVVLLGGPAPAAAPVDHLTLYSQGHDVRLQNLVVRGPDVDERDGLRGKGSRVVHVSEATLILEAVDVLRGAAADGDDGGNGDDATEVPAEAGSIGEHACQGTCSAAGGARGENTCDGLTANGASGGHGGSSNGGDGNDGGNALNAFGSFGFGGDGGSGVVNGACPGSAPDPGLPGRTQHGPGGVGGSSGSFVDGQWLGDAGQAGLLGSNGRGGGGGGGAGGCYIVEGDLRWRGGAGGGGGAGGCRSPAGPQGGGAGGASIGIHAVDAELVLQDVRIAGGVGGDGGLGGGGGAGQPGGDGGLGGGGNATVRPGAPGGPGGDGGHTGGGGGGVGGWIFGIVFDGGTLTGTPTYEDGTPGTGGPGGAAPVNGNPGHGGATGQQVDLLEL